MGLDRVGHVDEEGNFSIVHTFSKPGQTNCGCSCARTDVSSQTASAPVTYLISPRPRNSGP